MVGEDFEWFLCPDEIWSPVCDCFHNRQEFSVVDIVVPFGFRECGRIVCDWVVFGSILGVRATLL
jgi:hypothetical protein